jgi:hypothetical protein
MNKNIVKTESVAEFLARGGQIKTVALNKSSKTATAKAAKEIALTAADMKALPKALRIKYGIRG